MAKNVREIMFQKHPDWTVNKYGQVVDENGSVQYGQDAQDFSDAVVPEINKQKEEVEAETGKPTEKIVQATSHSDLGEDEKVTEAKKPMIQAEEEIHRQNEEKKAEKPVTVADVKEPETEAEKPMPSLNIEKDDTKKEVEEKKNTFLQNWAGTHPTLFNAVFGKNSPLTFGQRVSLLGSVLANIGANTLLGAQAGFNHSGFNPIASEWGDTIRQYSQQGVNKVLGAEQEAQGKQTAAEYLADLNKKDPERMAEVYATAALYSDNPEKLQAYLKAQGINASADEFKKAAAKYELTNLTEDEKQKRIDTESKILSVQYQKIQNMIAELDEEKQKAIQDKLIEATNAMNDFNAVKGSSDADTYKLEKYAGYAKNILDAVEGAVSTAAGVMTGGVVGSTGAIKDGIIKGDGTPQKIVKADGTEIKLDPNDNVYATLNTITTAKDDGSSVVPMEKEDRAVIYQKRLGYCGNPINKDFEYYLNKLRG